MENEEVKYAGFWIRVLATFLDFLVLMIPAGLNIYAIFMLKNFPLYLTLSVLLMLYKPFLEYKYGATLGKIALNIKVLQNDLQPVQLKNAILRATPWLLTGIFSLFTGILTFSSAEYPTTEGFKNLVNLQKESINTPIQVLINLFFFACVITVAFNDRKRGLHDKIGDTVCVRIPETDT